MKTKRKATKRPKRSAEIVAKNVRRIRIEFGMTQLELAEVCDWPQPMISKIEAGRGDHKLSTIDTLSKALSTKPATLFELPNS